MISRNYIKGSWSVLLCFALAGCTTIAPVKHHSVNAALKIKVTDPLLRDLAAVTKYAEIQANGEFAPGTYEIKGVAVRVDEGTNFTLRLKVPVDNPEVISTENASGKLVTSKSLNVKGFPVPKTIELQNGKATGDVDILRSVGAFFINVLEDQLTSNDRNNDIRQMVAFMAIDKAVLELKPGAFYRVGQKVLHFGPDSRVELDNAAIDNRLDYAGTCRLHFNLLEGSQWIGDKTDCIFSYGKADLKLSAQRENNELTLSLPEEAEKITLKDCTFRWGKEKRSSAHSDLCVLNLKELIWKKKQSAQKPTLHVSSLMDLDNTHVKIKTDTQETEAQFPEEVPADLLVDTGEETKLTQFATHRTEVASSVKVKIERPTTNLTIHLKDANIGPISLDKFGQFQFSLDHGNAKLKQLDWSTAKKTFTLATSGSSNLTLPEGMELSMSGKSGGAKMSLPIDVQLGAATLRGGDQQLKLSNLSGKLLVEVDKDVRIASDMNLSIEDSNLFGKNRADVKATGLDLQSNNGKAIASIKSCAVELSDDAIEEAIRDEVPKTKTWKINKKLPQQQWRYRNAAIDSATVEDLRLDSLRHDSTNAMKFSASGDVSVLGTVEKGGLLAALQHKTQGKWETKPWSASGHVTGGGTVKYELLPNRDLASSQLGYQLSMDLPIPEDVDLDWTKVSDGILQGAERAIVIKQMKKITVPIRIKGKLNLFSAKDKQWRTVKISHLTVRPSQGGTLLTFTAQAIF